MLDTHQWRHIFQRFRQSLKFHVWFVISEVAEVDVMDFDFRFDGDNATTAAKKQKSIFRKIV